MKELVWHLSEGNQSSRFGPAYYLGVGCNPVAVRIQAETAPTIGDVGFDIFEDGVSIFNTRGATLRNETTGAVTSVISDTSVYLSKNETTAEHAEDFKDNILAAGAWITCKHVSGGDGKNFTVQLDLLEVSEEYDTDV